MGSLFQLRNYWSTTLFGSECSPSAFIVANVDNEKEDKIVVGTFGGNLQVWSPSSKEMDAHDLLLERQFEDPILQLCCADFEELTEDVTQNLLAILFPRKVAFARLIRHTEEAKYKESEESEKENIMEFYFYSFEICFEAELPHTAFNMTVGNFGRARHALLCVQALNGHLSFIDRHKVLFSGFLPSNQFLLPGYMAYSLERDLLVTHNSSMFLMCYSFSSIVTAFHKASMNASSISYPSSGSRGNFGDAALPPLGAALASASSPLLPTWAFNLGEDVVGIEVCDRTATKNSSRHLSTFPLNPNQKWMREDSKWGDSGASGFGKNDSAIQNKKNLIVVLCLYHLYILDASGTCLHSRQLDVEGISLKSYFVSNQGVDNILVGTASGAIEVYAEEKLVWKAQIPSTSALALGVGNIGGVQGMIVVLGENRTLTVSYLGTNPAETPLKLLDSRVHQYSEMLEELSSLAVVVQEVDQKVKCSYITAKDKNKDGRNSSPSSVPSRVIPNLQEPIAELHTAEAATGEEAERAVEKEYIQLEVTFSDLLYEAPHNSVNATFCISLSSDTPAHHSVSNVLVQILTTEPIRTIPAAITFESLQHGKPMECIVRIAPYKEEGKNMIPSSLNMFVVLSSVVTPPFPPSSSSAEDTFASKEDNMFFIQRQYELPLALVASPIAIAPKSMPCSLQLNTEKASPPSLTELFSDLSPLGVITSNYLGIEYVNGDKAAVLVSKNGGRFKIKSTSMNGIWLLFFSFFSRVKEYYRKKGEGVELDLPDALPLEECLTAVAKHHSVRKEVELEEARLQQASGFHRLVEKRILSRLKEQNPFNTNALDLLLTEAHFIIQQAMEKVIVAKSSMQQECANLNSISQLFSTCLVIKCKTTISQREASVLKQLLQCRISDDAEDMWQERLYDTLQRWRKGVEGETKDAPLSLNQLGGVITGSSENVESPDDYNLQRLEEHLKWLHDHLLNGKPLLV